RRPGPRPGRRRGGRRRGTYLADTSQIPRSPPVNVPAGQGTYLAFLAYLARKYTPACPRGAPHGRCRARRLVRAPLLPSPCPPVPPSGRRRADAERPPDADEPPRTLSPWSRPSSRCPAPHTTASQPRGRWDTRPPW